MGLSGHLHDVSGDSIPLLLLAAVATSISYLRSLLLRLVHLQHLVSASGASVDSVDVEHAAALGSGLAGLVVLADHLASSPSFAFALPDPPPEAGDGGARRPGPRPECVVCLCGLGDGDRVRRLPCRHVFHRECIDGWFRQMNLSCPLCRSPIAPPELRSACDRRIGRELVAWLSTSSY